MSDVPTTDATATFAPDNSASAPAPADTGAPSGDFLDQPAPNEWDPAYLGRIREEAATWRTKAREYEQTYGVFDRYEPDERQVWVELAELWETNPDAAADYMRRIADATLGPTAPAAVPTPQLDQGDLFGGEFADDAAETNGGLTAEQVQQIIEQSFAEREYHAQLDAAVTSVYDEVRAAGFDPTSFDGVSVLWRAANETRGDVAAAVAAHKAYQQQIVDSYVAGKQAVPQAAPAGGVPAVQPPQITSMEDAFRQGRAFLANLSQQP